jgi:predicted SnoaL-like aldol condensation-catalyzing enzyme
MPGWCGEIAPLLAHSASWHGARNLELERALNPTPPEHIALVFNAQINAHDLAALGALMTADHAFIDRDGQVTAGKAATLDAWKRFFTLFPDYCNTFTRVESQGELVVLSGYATWHPGDPPDPAIWTARIAGGFVAEWRIYTDTQENRRQFFTPSFLAGNDWNE